MSYSENKISDQIDGGLYDQQQAYESGLIQINPLLWKSVDIKPEPYKKCLFKVEVKTGYFRGDEHDEYDVEYVDVARGYINTQGNFCECLVNSHFINPNLEEVEYDSSVKVTHWIYLDEFAKLLPQ